MNVTIHQNKMDYIPSEASLSQQPLTQNLKIPEGENHNRGVFIYAQQEIEIVNLPWMNLFVEQWASS